MDNSRIMRSYVSPIFQMIKSSLTTFELEKFEKRVNEFYINNGNLDSESFKKKVRSEFELEVEIARYHNIQSTTNVIKKTVVFFFWFTIATLIISLFAAISFLQ